jgi:hypothetical protein
LRWPTPEVNSAIVKGFWPAAAIPAALITALKKGREMLTTESTTKQPDQNHHRDRELVRAITDVLVLAVGKRAARQALRQARAEAGQRRAVRAAAHLAGYSALLGYIWHQRRTATIPESDQPRLEA